jgi:hypothetical protein
VCVRQGMQGPLGEVRPAGQQAAQSAR